MEQTDARGSGHATGGKNFVQKNATNSIITAHLRPLKPGLQKSCKKLEFQKIRIQKFATPVPIYPKKVLKFYFFAGFS